MLVSVPFQISCGSCPQCLRGRSSNCSAVPFMSTYGFGPAVAEWGGFLSERRLRPLRRADARAAARGPRAGERGERLGQHRRRLPGRRPRASSRTPARRCSSWAGRRPDRSASTPPGSPGRSARSGSSTSTPTSPAAGAPKPWAPRRWPRCRSASGPFPITVDASADPEGLALALRSTAPDGTCTSCAIYFGEQPSLPLLEMYTKGITFRTGRANAREAIPHVLELASSGALRPSGSRA